MAVFGVMTHLAGPDDSDQELEHYAGLAKENPFLATVLAIGLGSLAGIPPLAGFMGKFFVFVAAFEAGARWLLGDRRRWRGDLDLLLLRLDQGRLLFGDLEAIPGKAAVAPAPSRTPVDLLAGAALVVLALGSLALGFFPGPFGHLLALR